MTQRRVIFFSPNGQLHGPRRRTHNFSIGLAEQGIETVVYCKTFYHATGEIKNTNILRVESETTSGVMVHWVPSISYSTNGLRRLASELQFCAITLMHYVFSGTSKEDVIVADSVTPFNGITGLIASKMAGARYIHQIRDVWPWGLLHDGSIKKFGVQYATYRILEKMQYRFATAICSALPNTRSHVDASGGRGKKITYIQNGVDVTNFPYTNYEPNKVIKAVYVGTISPAHDLASVLKAFEELQAETREIKFELHVYGDGSKRPALESWVREHNVRGIYFHGRVSRTEVPEKLAAGDILICPVLDSKAYDFGLNLNKLYDYFAAGRPILLSSPCKENDVIKAGAGYSVEAESSTQIKLALLKFSKASAKEKKIMAANSRSFAEQEYAITPLKNKFRDMINELNN